MMLSQRRSALSGEMVSSPAGFGNDLAAQLAEAMAAQLAGQLAETRVRIATEQAKREAAEAQLADARARLDESMQRCARLEADLERAHGRIDSLAKAPPTPASPTPPTTPQEPAAPVAYEATVTQRDRDGKIVSFQLVPREA